MKVNRQFVNFIIAYLPFKSFFFCTCLQKLVVKTLRYESNMFSISILNIKKYI